jgi:transposase
MLTQEEFMDVLAMRRQGLSISEIAEETGYHPATISKWVKSGGPPLARRGTTPAAIDERWSKRIDQLLIGAPRLLATSVFEILRTEGFSGSYPSVVRELRERRGPRFRGRPAVSVRIETPPGEEAQFDFSDATAWGGDWGIESLQCFSAILSWSRWRWWWFTTSVDREHTLEGLVRFFEAAGGVPKVVRTDRMGALGTSQGRRFKLHSPTAEFARFHGTEVRACQAADAKRKGKVERPFRTLKETFLEEQRLDPPDSVGELNARVGPWLAGRVHSRPNRTTGVAPDERLDKERRLLAELPRRRFDTAYVEVRRVHVAVPQIEWRGVRFSVPPGCVGQRVEVRHEIDADHLEIRWAGQLVRAHRLPEPGVVEVWHGDDWAAAQASALGERPRLAVVGELRPEPQRQCRIELAGDYDVDAVDLSRYDLDSPSETVR